MANTDVALRKSCFPKEIQMVNRLNELASKDISFTILSFLPQQSIFVNDKLIYTHQFPFSGADIITLLQLCPDNTKLFICTKSKLSTEIVRTQTQFTAETYEIHSKYNEQNWIYSDTKKIFLVPESHSLVRCNLFGTDRHYYMIICKQWDGKKILKRLYPLAHRGIQIYAANFYCGNTKLMDIQPNEQEIVDVVINPKPMGT